MASVSIDYNDFEVLTEKLIEIGSEALVNRINKDVIKAGQEYGLLLATPIAPRSKGKTAGHKVYSSGQHAADNIPVSNVVQKATGHKGTIGWLPSDNSVFFYEKFPIFGTVYMDEHPTFEPIEDQVESFIKRMAEEEYLAAIEGALL